MSKNPLSGFAPKQTIESSALAAHPHSATQRFHISVVKTFGTCFDICEVGRIDILGAGGIRPDFFMDVCRYQLFGSTVECFGLFVVQSTEIVSNKSHHRGRATKRQMFFVSDKAEGYFVSSHLEWGF